MKLLSDCTVLIVDDEQVNLDVLVGTLKASCKTLTAQDGPMALSLAESASPDLILLDIMLPGMDGLAVCQKLKTNPRTKDIPVIFITALGDQQDEYKGFELGAVDYIIKPFANIVVKARVETHLNLVLARRELKEMYDQTLLGSVRVVSELLSLTNKTACGQTHNVRRLAKAMAKDLKRPNPWKHDLAAQFSNLGCIRMAPDALHNIYSQKGEVSDEDRVIFNENPKLSADLIRKIPRLEDVATIIEGQCNVYAPDSDEPLAIARQILRTAIDFNNMQFKGMTDEEALSVLKGSLNPYDPDVIASLERVLKVEGENVGVFELPPDKITLGMLLDQDVLSSSGVLLAAKDMEVDVAVMKIMARLTRKGSEQLIRVRAPKGTSV